MPWAGLAAAVLVFVADRTLFAHAGLWRWLEERLELVPRRLVRVELGIAGDRLALARLDAAAPEVERVLVMGNSRAHDGFQFEDVPARFALGEFTHAPISPLELRLFAREAAAHRADLLIVMLSEFDTHHPVRVVPRAGFADLRATTALAFAALAGRSPWSPRFLLDKRVGLERLALAAVFDAYRYRDALDRAWLDAQLGFDADAGRLPLLVKHELEEADEAPGEIPDLEAARALFGPAFEGRFPDSYIPLLRGIRSGPYIAANEGLVEDAVAILRAAGCEVLIVEGPLHPASYQLYDHAATRAEFLAFARRMEREHRVHLLLLEDSGPYPEGDFADPLHLSKRRGQQLGALTLQHAAGILDQKRGPAESRANR
jgi:hypothetical protein